MGITREDLIRKGRDLQLSDEEWAKELAVRQSVIDRYMNNDEWANKTFKKVGIFITSHPGNRPYLKACIDSHKKLGYWMTLVYDNHFDPNRTDLSYNQMMPALDVMHNVDLFMMPHHTTWGGVLYPWFWLMKWGTLAMQQFEYIYSVNGDFILEKPENFDKLLAHMGDADIMSYGPNEERSVSTCFIAKRQALLDIMNHVEGHFVPFDNYEKYTQEYGNAEGRFARAIQDLGLKLAPVEPPYNEQMHIKGYGTWYDLVGYRHLHGEHNYAYRYGRKDQLLPPEIQHLDGRFMGDEYRLIKQYWETRDISVLDSWYCK